MTVNNRFQDFGEDLQENYDAEGGGRIIGRPGWFVPDDDVGFLQRERVEHMGHQGGEQVEYESWGDRGNALLDRIGGHIRARGQ